jgi:hypothetical protein
VVETSSKYLLLVQRLFDPSLHDGRQFMAGRFKVYELTLDDESGRVVERVEAKNTNWDDEEGNFCF